MCTLFFVCLGGSLGALFRFYLSLAIDTQFLGFGRTYSLILEISSHMYVIVCARFLDIFFTLFPLGVLFVNALGSFMLGAFFGYMKRAKKEQDGWHKFFVVGFLGSLTTFSTFSLDSIKLMLPTLLNLTFLQRLPSSKQFLNYAYTIFGFDITSVMNNGSLPYSQNFVIQHAFLLGISNLLLNIAVCICFVWLGYVILYKKNVRQP